MREKADGERKEPKTQYSLSESEMPRRRTASFRHSEAKERDAEIANVDESDRCSSTPTTISRPIPIKYVVITNN
jgi:hypothetical protein